MVTSSADSIHGLDEHSTSRVDAAVPKVTATLVDTQRLAKLLIQLVNTRTDGETEFRGSQSSGCVFASGTAMQRQRSGDTEEHGSQQWT